MASRRTLCPSSGQTPDSIVYAWAPMLPVCEAVEREHVAVGRADLTESCGGGPGDARDLCPGCGERSERGRELGLCAAEPAQVGPGRMIAADLFEPGGARGQGVSR